MRIRKGSKSKKKANYLLAHTIIMYIIGGGTFTRIEAKGHVCTTGVRLSKICKQGEAREADKVPAVQDQCEFCH